MKDHSKVNREIIKKGEEEFKTSQITKSMNAEKKKN